MLGFTLGDFACCLYWQSISIFLLFYYTDSVGLPAATAGVIYMIASIWDGVIDPVMGALADRTRSRWGRYRPYILLGPIPLAASFILLYYKPPFTGALLTITLLVTHIVFRSCYTAVSIPYTSLSARLTSDSRDRSAMAGLRMMFAMAAGMAVGYFTLPIVAFDPGPRGQGFFYAAGIFALVSLAIFPIVFLATREPPLEPESARPRMSVRDFAVNLRANRAFWIAMVGIVCAAGCLTIFGKTVLYYFKYYLDDEAAVQRVITIQSGAGLVILPVWIFVERSIGKQAAWFVATLWGLAGLGYFAAVDIRSSTQMTWYLLYMQVSFLGMAMTFWSILPDTVEYGEWRTNIRAESLVFGFGQFFLKLALGLAAGVFGWALTAAGYVPNVAQTAQTLRAMKSIMIVLPTALLVAGGIAMLFYPMPRGRHEIITRELAQRTAAGARVRVSSR